MGLTRTITKEGRRACAMIFEEGEASGGGHKGGIEGVGDLGNCGLESRWQGVCGSGSKGVPPQRGAQRGGLALAWSRVISYSISR